MASSEPKHIAMFCEISYTIKLGYTKIILLLIIEEFLFVSFEIPLKIPSIPHGDLKNIVNRFCLKIYETRLKLKRRK